MGATQILAEWAETSGNWSDKAQEITRRAFLDTIACMIAGASAAASQSTRQPYLRWAAGSGSTVIGTPDRLPAPWAALANGTAAHALDYDDALTPALSHPSAVLVPAILAVAEDERSSGAQCIDAYIIGLEVSARLGEAMNQAHYHRGWHTTLTIGAPAVAAACARLLGLDRKKIGTAMSIATSMSGGSKRQFGTGVKPLHAGLAAQNGLVAARLAASGLTAADEIFEGHWGMLEMTAGNQAPGFSRPLQRLGTALAIEEDGGWFKLYPCCAATHRPIDAVLAIRQRERISASDVETVKVWVSEIAHANLQYRVPENDSQARFSLPFCVMQALTAGRVDLQSFTPGEIARPELRALLGRVEMLIDDELKADRAISDTIEWARVRITMRNGDIFEETVQDPRGYPTKPATVDELETKFRTCTATNPELDAITLLDLLRKFRELADVTALMANLRITR
jgi:2-methylcitrate dehydratase PrpD